MCYCLVPQHSTIAGYLALSSIHLLLDTKRLKKVSTTSSQSCLGSAVERNQPPKSKRKAHFWQHREHMSYDIMVKKLYFPIPKGGVLQMSYDIETTGNFQQCLELEQLLPQRHVNYNYNNY